MTKATLIFVAGFLVVMLYFGVEVFEAVVLGKS